MVKKNSRLIFGMIFSILFLLSFSNFVSAGAIESGNITLIIGEKRADNILNGNTIVNVSLRAAQEQNWTVAQAYIQSAGATANNSLILINGTANVRNVTTDTIYYNISITIPSLSVEDGNDYTLTINLFNGTAHFNKTASVTVDNTIPQSPTLSPTTNSFVSSSGTQNFSGTVTDANTTSCTYTIFRDGSSSDSASSSGSTSYSSSSCSFTKSFSSTADNGLYYWAIIASDGTNTTASSTNLFKVSIPSSNGGLPAENIQDLNGQKINGKTLSIANEKAPLSDWMIIFGIILSLAIVSFVIIKRKKR